MTMTQSEWKEEREERMKERKGGTGIGISGYRILFNMRAIIDGGPRYACQNTPVGSTRDVPRQDLRPILDDYDALRRYV